MRILQNSKLPTFFNYNEEGGDTGYETIQDFFLSWTLRCADKTYHKINPKLNQFAVDMLLGLAFGNNNNDGNFKPNHAHFKTIEIHSVKTLRQKEQIDLIADIIATIDGNDIHIILNIENKWYSNIRKNQLEKSRAYIESHYKNADHISNLVIYCDYVKIEKDPSISQRCKNNNYKLATIEDLKEIATA